MIRRVVFAALLLRAMMAIFREKYRQ